MREKLGKSGDGRNGDPGQNILEATVSETIFAAESRAVVALLDGARRMDRVLLALATTDDFFTALGLDEGARLAWLKEMVPSRKESGDEYRAKREDPLAVIRDPSRFGPVHQILGRRRAALRHSAGLLAGLEADGKLTQPRAKLYASYVHMHCNRLWGDPNAERRVLGLLLRTGDAILHQSEPAPPS